MGINCCIHINIGDLKRNLRNIARILEAGSSSGVDFPLPSPSGVNDCVPVACGNRLSRCEFSFALYAATKL